MPPRLLTPSLNLWAAVPTFQRLFSTSSQLHRIAPESPRFVEIPQPPRTPPSWKPIVKGKLPQPKEIFRSVGPDKTSAEYLALVTPEPTKRKVAPPGKPEDAVYISWKARMAEKRRRNLREGLIELAQKKKDFDDLRKRILERRTAERQALIEKKEREDVRLTLPSVLSTLKKPEPFGDPNREARLKTVAKRLNRREWRKAAAREELIHNLYLNASNFLLTEKQLDMAIDQEFVDQSVVKIFPPNTADMMAKKIRKPTMANFGGSTAAESELLMEVSGALTGGKLPKGGLKTQSTFKYEHKFNV
ncbi:hypothetical protein BDZ91DRAFT_846346 [Kalaharituber pfeilii]|nr:hypothetical protein BDZ91DRAFT_846346 [Kalaharituber pfeilii]